MMGYPPFAVVDARLVSLVRLDDLCTVVRFNTLRYDCVGSCSPHKRSRPFTCPYECRRCCCCILQQDCSQCCDALWCVALRRCSRRWCRPPPCSRTSPQASSSIACTVTSSHRFAVQMTARCSTSNRSVLRVRNTRHNNRCEYITPELFVRSLTFH
jgi:hypothetical protein